MSSYAWFNALTVAIGSILIDIILTAIFKRKKLLSMTTKDIKRKAIVAILVFGLFFFYYSK